MTLPTAHPIERILADPLVRAAMKADRIEVSEMKSLLCNVRRRLTASPAVQEDVASRYGVAANAGRIA